MKRISTRDDFPNCGVFEVKPGFYSIVFKNPEAAGEWWGMVLALQFVIAVLIGMAAFGWLLMDLKAPWWVAVFGVPGALALFGWWLMQPGKPLRTIEMDTNANILRVRRKHRVKVERKLSLLRNLSIEEHRLAQTERIRRRGVIGMYQKQHCLVGWFGAGQVGAEQVELVCRHEWPSLGSLQEVQQAMTWVAQMHLAGGPPEEREAGESGALPGRAFPAIKPPLD